MKKLRVVWNDGYEMTFDLTVGSIVRFETAYIYLVEESGEKFIPLQNVRFFGYVD